MQKRHCIGLISFLFCVLVSSVVQADIYDDFAGHQDMDESIRHSGLSFILGAEAEELMVKGHMYTTDQFDPDNISLVYADLDDDQKTIHDSFPTTEGQEQYLFDQELKTVVEDEDPIALHSKAVYFSPVVGVQYMHPSMRYALYATLGFKAYKFTDEDDSPLFKDQFWQEDLGFIFYPSLSSKIEPFIMASVIETEHQLKELSEPVDLQNKTARGYSFGIGLEGKLLDGIHWRLTVSKAKMKPLRIKDVVTSQPLASYSQISSGSESSEETSSPTSVTEIVETVEVDGGTTTTTTTTTETGSEGSEETTIETESDGDTSTDPSISYTPVYSEQSAKKITYQNVSVNLSLIFVLGSLF